MVLNPEVQKKAQGELDTVLGGTRLPAFADKEALPYVNALVKEVLRWHPVVPLGEFYLFFHGSSCSFSGISDTPQVDS